MARFVLHTMHTGAADLGAALPLSATVVREIRGGDGRRYWQARLDRPVTYQPPGDTVGATLWIYGLVVTGRVPGSALHTGMRDFAVDVAVVIDNRVGDDDRLDPHKVAAVGSGLINDIDREVPSAVSPVVASVVPASDIDATAATFRTDLQTWQARLASMAGEQPDVMPRETDTGIGYSLAPGKLTYRVAGPDGTILTRSTADYDELLFWIIDDLAHDLATHWTQRAPAFGGDDDASRALLLQRWHNLMAALSTDWGHRTQARTASETAQTVKIDNSTPATAVR